MAACIAAKYAAKKTNLTWFSKPFLNSIVDEISRIVKKGIKPYIASFLCI